MESRKKSKEIDLFAELQSLPPTPEGFHKALNILSAKIGALAEMAVAYTSPDSEWGAMLSAREIDALKAANSEVRLVLNFLENQELEMHRRALLDRATPAMDGQEAGAA